MKNVIKVSLLGMVLLFSTQLIGQDHKKEKKTPEERSEMMTNKMTKSLELSSEQQEKVKASNLKLAKEHESIRAEQKALNERKKATLEQHDAEMKEVLTKEQYEKYLQQKEEKKENIKERRKK